MSEPKNYQPKIEGRVKAMRFTGDNANEIAEWWGDPWVVDAGGKYSNSCNFLYIYEDGDGEFELRNGDWLVLQGDRFFRLTASEFGEMYEEAM